MSVTSEMLDEIESALVAVDFDITVSRTVEETAEYDFVIDYIEPYRAYAYLTQDVFDVELDSVPESGTLLLYEESSGDVYACGVGQYNSLGEMAFEPLQEHFRPS